MKKEYESRIHLADTDGNRLVVIYKAMPEEERKNLLEHYWAENRWGTRFGAPDVLDIFPMDESYFPNKWFDSARECEQHSTTTY